MYLCRKECSTTVPKLATYDNKAHKTQWSKEFCQFKSKFFNIMILLRTNRAH